MLRNNETYLDVLGAQRIPDPTTAGDFLRRFGASDIDTLMNVIAARRLAVWQRQPASFFEQAIIEADGTIVETSGECKKGVDLSYNGKWGYHPLLVSLANTQELLFLYNAVRCGFAPEKILFLAEHATFTQPYGRETVERTLLMFHRRFFSQQFKRSCLPDGPKVGTVSLSPRGDWRMPSDADPSAWIRWASRTRDVPA